MYVNAYALAHVYVRGGLKGSRLFLSTVWLQGGLPRIVRLCGRYFYQISRLSSLPLLLFKIDIYVY